jgi:hypothetical protein
MPNVRQTSLIASPSSSRAINFEDPHTLGGFAIGKDGYVARRVIEPGELQPSVLRGTFRGLVGKRLCVAGREIPPDLCTTRRIIDQDEPPRLAQTY